MKFDLYKCPQDELIRTILKFARKPRCHCRHLIHYSVQKNVVNFSVLDWHIVQNYILLLSSPVFNGVSRQWAHCIRFPLCIICTDESFCFFSDSLGKMKLYFKKFFSWPFTHTLRAHINTILCHFSFPFFNAQYFPSMERQRSYTSRRM